MYKRGFNDRVYFTKEITAEICVKCDVFVICKGKWKHLSKFDIIHVNKL